MFRYVCLTVAFFVSCAHAGMPDDDRKELQKSISEIVQTCMKDFDISPEDFEKAKKSSDFSNVDSCFVRCMMKGKKLIDDKGMFDVTTANEIAEKFIKSPDDLAKAKKVTDTCKSVNDQAVGDGNKGCERAKLLLQCLMDNRSILM